MSTPTITRSFLSAVLCLGSFSAVAAASDENAIPVRAEPVLPPYTFSCHDGLYATIAGYLQVKEVKLEGASSLKLDVPSFARKVPVTAVIQPGPAPLVVVLPGIAGRADADFSKLWPSWYAGAGYHVLTFNSTFRAEFMDISGQGVSGNVWAESEGIAKIIEAFLKLPAASRVTKVGVAGMSYGGVQALILAKMGREGRLPFELSAVQAYSPPLKMDKTAALFDRWYNEHRWEHTQIEMLNKVGKHKPACQECSAEVCEVCQGAPLDGGILKAALSASFQAELVNVVIRANDKYHLNLLPNGDLFTEAQVKADYAATWGYEKYAYDLALPFWEKKLKLDSLNELILSSHLCRLALELPAYAEIILAADDPFNEPEDLDEFEACTTSNRVTLLPHGGHLGYVKDSWTKAKLLTLFSPSLH